MKRRARLTRRERKERGEAAERETSRCVTAAAVNQDEAAPFTFAERAADKARSRLDDELALCAGLKSREQLRQENSRIVLPNAKMLLSRAKRLS